jgi:hypothetical protein
MKITFYGHASLGIEVAGKHILVDPFISGNPLVAHYIDINSLQADYISTNSRSWRSRARCRGYCGAHKGNHCF